MDQEEGSVTDVRAATKVAFYDRVRGAVRTKGIRYVDISFEPDGGMHPEYVTGITFPVSEFEKRLRAAATPLNPSQAKPSQAVAVGLRAGQLAILVPRRQRGFFRGK